LDQQMREQQNADEHKQQLLEIKKKYVAKSLSFFDMCNPRVVMVTLCRLAVLCRIRSMGCESAIMCISPFANPDDVPLLVNRAAFVSNLQNAAALLKITDISLNFTELYTTLCMQASFSIHYQYHPRMI